jgi:hypothetical protein
LPLAIVLVDVDWLAPEHFRRAPDMSDLRQRVAFGTSGHRETPEDGTFADAHRLSICEHLHWQGIGSPLFLAKERTRSSCSPTILPRMSWPLRPVHASSRALRRRP